MAIISLTLPYDELPVTGKLVTFRSPCSSEQVDSVFIGGEVYTLLTTEGSTSISKSFPEGVLVSVLLDVELKRAYIQGSSSKNDKALPIEQGGTGATTAEEALENLGAAPVSHTHSDYASSSHTHDEYASSSHKHTTGDITSGTLSVSRGGTGKNTLTSGSFLKGNGTSAVTLRTPAQVLSDIGAAAASHNQEASTITEGTLAGRVQANATAVATVGNMQVRNIKASTTDLTAGTSTLSSGDIYLVYE